MSSNKPQESGFIGRHRELALLTAALDEAMFGRGQVVMLAGEPGIGKTRTAQELAALAAARGARVLWGRCYEREGAPPYWPWLQLIRSYVEETEPERLRQEMGPGASDILEVFPELLLKLIDLEPPPALEPAQARFRLLFSVCTFLKNSSQNQPLVLVLDDLHCADDSSLLLLEFLGREISESSLMVVGIYRDSEVSLEHPLFGTLAGLSRNEPFQRQVLEGLAPADVGEFILAAKGSKASQKLVDAVHAHTEGNPFFIIEVIRLLAGRNELGDVSVGSGASALPVPRGVFEVVGQRLNRLSKGCKDLLTTAAVIGRQFDFKLLGLLTEGTNELELLAMMEDALAAQIVQESPGGEELYQFSHALVQQTLLERLSSGRRVRLHERIGEALETLYGDSPGSHAAELAYHFAEAVPVSGTDKLVKYSLLAGTMALEAYAHEEAIENFQQGLAAKGLDADDTMPAPDAEAAALLFGLGRAQAAMLGRQELDVAAATLNRAFDFYAKTDDAAHAVAVAAYPLQTLPGHRLAVDLVSRALRLVPPDSPEAGLLLSRYALVLGLEEGDYQGAMEASDGALAIARLAGDEALEVRILVNSSMVDYWHLRWKDTVAKGLRAIELARRAGDQSSEVAARFWVGITLLGQGESKGAKPHATAILRTAESLRDRYWLATALWFNERASMFEGDWQAAKDFNDRGISASPSDTRLLATRTLTEFQVGNEIIGQRYLDELVAALRLAPPGPKYDYASAALIIPIIANITGDLDQLHVAESAAETVLSAGSATPFVSRGARLGLALASVLRGDVEAAREHYVGLSSAHGSYLFVSGDRVLGLLAQTMGDLDRSVAHFEDARAFCHKAGYKPELAWTCYDHAAALVQRDGRGDRENAGSLLQEGLSIAAELGMTPLMDKAAAIQKKIRLQPGPSPAYPGGLTAREMEVLSHLARGKTNREIARELVLSERTVARHISNIYAKITVRNRAEATTFALSHLTS